MHRSLYVVFLCVSKKKNWIIREMENCSIATTYFCVDQRKIKCMNAFKIFRCHKFSSVKCWEIVLLLPLSKNDVFYQIN